MTNLPVRSEKREIVSQHRERAVVNVRPRRHLRRYQSGQVVLINPEIVPKQIILPPKNIVTRPATSGFISRIQLPPRKKVEEKLKTVHQKYTFVGLQERVHEKMENSAYRNEVEFYDTNVDQPVHKLLSAIELSPISDKEVDEKLQEIAEKADLELEYDADDPIISVYENGDWTGSIGEYTYSVNSLGIDLDDENTLEVDEKKWTSIEDFMDELTDTINFDSKTNIMNDAFKEFNKRDINLVQVSDGYRLNEFFVNKGKLTEAKKIFRDVVKQRGG